jgi:protein-S-isoprenylcysteine O-methyltransferase Ste14
MWFKHIVSIVFLPITVLVILPVFLIVIFYGELFWGLQLIRGIFVLIVGLAFVVFGLILLIYTISLFILYGDGTIAPWHPTKHLIKSGIYGCVRNPMIIGVFLILIGESFVFGSLTLLLYVVVFITANLLYIPLIEETRLVKIFGEEYLKYKNEVPRWLPKKCLRNRFAKILNEANN